MEYKAGGKEKMKELLIVVDMQNDFVTGVLGSAEARAVLPKLKQKIDGARTAGKTIVFTRDTHGADYLSTQEGRNLPGASLYPRNRRLANRRRALSERGQGV